MGDGRPLVTVVEHDGPALGPVGLDLRAEGLWADQICETPLEHWTVGLEAFGVALDDPAEAFSGCRGDRTALGFDLEWESEPDALVEADGGYELACRVHGEILVGAERLVVDDGWGGRRHRWGDGPATGDPPGRVWGRVDGTRFDTDVTVVLDAAGMPAPLTVSVAGATVEVVPRHHAPVSSTTGIRLHRSLASVEEGGSPSGQAWVERWEGEAGGPPG